MKKALIAVLTLAVLLTCGAAHAKRVATLENGTLVVTETTELARITNIPKGLEANIADDLITGKLPEYKIEDAFGKWTETFKFPWVWIETRYTDRIVSYQDGHFVPRALPTRLEPLQYSVLGTVLLVLIPILGILLVSIMCPLHEISLKTLLFFYLVVFVSVVGGIVDPIVGIVVGMVSGAVSGLFITKDDYSFASAVVVGMCVGASGSVFLEGSIQPYALFLLGVCVNSFILAYGVAEIRRIRRELRGTLLD